MVKIAFVTNAPPRSGMGKPVRELLAAARQHAHFDIDDFYLDAAALTVLQNGKRIRERQPLPHLINLKPLQWWRLSRCLPARGYGLWHFTNQTLSFIPRSPAVVTVHDLIELVNPQAALASLAARFLYRGLPRAAHLICVSRFTRDVVQQQYGLDDANLSVIPEAASAAFRPLPNARATVAWRQFLWQHRLTPQHKIVLYVGSEHPRKNLTTLLKALAVIRRRHPQTILIKVGEPGLLRGRAALLNQLDRLQLRAATRFIPSCSDADLQLLYAAADVFVYPSTYEGFGLPPLEALACACPTVCANTTSLPEVVGGAALLCPPLDHEAFASSIQKIFEQPGLAADLRQRGPRRAAQFSWADIAIRTAEVYQRVLASLRLDARSQQGKIARRVLD